MNRFNYSLIILIAYIFSANAQAAGIKKWTDENGRVYYGDTPPLSVNTQTIKPSKRPSVLGKPLPRLKASDDSDKKNTPASSASQSSLEPEQAKEACDVAKKDLAVIKNSSRIQLRSADGSLRYMTKDEIKQRQEKSEANIEKFCQ